MYAEAGSFTGTAGGFTGVGDRRRRALRGRSPGRRNRRQSRRRSSRRRPNRSRLRRRLGPRTNGSRLRRPRTDRSRLSGRRLPALRRCSGLGEQAQFTCLGPSVPGRLHLVEFGVHAGALRHGRTFRHEGGRREIARGDVLLDRHLAVGMPLRRAERRPQLSPGRDLVDEPEPKTVVLGLELEAPHHRRGLRGRVRRPHLQITRRRLGHLLHHLAPRPRRRLLRHRLAGGGCGGRGRTRDRLGRRSHAGRLRIAGLIGGGCEGCLCKQCTQEDQSCPPCCCGHWVSRWACDGSDCRYA